MFKENLEQTKVNRDENEFLFIEAFEVLSKVLSDENIQDHIVSICDILIDYGFGDEKRETLTTRLYTSIVGELAPEIVNKIRKKYNSGLDD